MKKLTQIRIFLFSLLFLFSLGTAHASQVKLMGARLSQFGQQTRIVFEFNKKFTYQIATTRTPARIIVDFPATILETNLRQIHFNNSAITAIHETMHHGNTLRIALLLNRQAKMSSFVLKPQEQYGYRLVIDIDHSKHTTTSSVSATSSASYATADTAVISEPVVKTEQNITRNREIIVVIDPGHGGKDPGATGPMGIHEKNVVLKISNDIARNINAMPGMKAELTRDGDYYITLRDRLRIARQDHADFFVAVHADAYPKRNARGASVFALSQRGATSEAAHWLAEKENYSELGGVYLANKSRLLRSVLIDLSQTATISQSLQVGHDVLYSIGEVTPLHSHKVEQARFMVLKSPDIPSLLIETGFISNPSEEDRLDSSSYQRKMAKAISQGIINYFVQHPPARTYFAKHHYGKNTST